MYDCGFTKENNWFRYRAAAIIVDFVCIKIYVKTNSALFLQLENAQEMQEKVYV